MNLTIRQESLFAPRRKTQRRCGCKTKPFVRFITAVLSVACTKQPEAVVAKVSLQLDSLQSYGVPTTNDKVELGGASFATVNAIAFTRDSTLYVLDSKYKKVVVFNVDGTLRRVFGRYGSRDGEFKLPIAMDVVGNEIWIYDYKQKRITEVDTTGRFIRAFPVEVWARGIRVVGGQLWLSRLADKKWMLDRYDTLGNKIASELPVRSEQLSYSPNGAVAILGRADSGSLLVADQRPGIWYTSVSDTFVRHGTLRLASQRPIEIGGAKSSAGDTFGIATCPNRVLVLHTIRDRSHPR